MFISPTNLHSRAAGASLSAGHAAVAGRLQCMLAKSHIALQAVPRVFLAAQPRLLRLSDGQRHAGGDEDLRKGLREAVCS